ncbi:hypothetical protein EVAR_99746_1, partial [Eumeta japonica]
MRLLQSRRGPAPRRRRDSDPTIIFGFNLRAAGEPDRERFPHILVRELCPITPELFITGDYL